MTTYRKTSIREDLKKLPVSLLAKMDAKFSRILEDTKDAKVADAMTRRLRLIREETISRDREDRWS